MITAKQKIQRDYNSAYDMHKIGLEDAKVVLLFFDLNMILFEKLGVKNQAKNYREMCAELLITSENKNACSDVDSEVFELLDDFMLEIDLC